jgi:hypothetical protein
MGKTLWIRLVGLLALFAWGVTAIFFGPPRLPPM